MAKMQLDNPDRVLITLEELLETTVKEVLERQREIQLRWQGVIRNCLDLAIIQLMAQINMGLTMDLEHLTDKKEVLQIQSLHQSWHLDRVSTQLLILLEHMDPSAL